MEELNDVRSEVDDGLAWIVIDRSERLNAFRARTIDELLGPPRAGVRVAEHLASACPCSSIGRALAF